MNKNEDLFTGCPVQHARQFLAGKWQMGILWNLSKQTLRFSEIRNLLPEISDKALMQELDFFVEKKIIERNKSEFPSPKIEYVLSETGKSLIPVITAIVKWGYTHLQEERISKEMTMTPLPVIQEIESNMSDETSKLR